MFDLVFYIILLFEVSRLKKTWLITKGDLYTQLYIAKDKSNIDNQ